MNLLTCPRCAQLCEPDCKYCAECGCRLLPNAKELELLHELHEHWSTLPVDEDGWSLAAAEIRLAYGAGYTDGLDVRLGSEVQLPDDGTANRVGGASLASDLASRPADDSGRVDS